ncbi:MAG: undecaprenyl-diphosphate phosphatase [Promethearchaeota archaeon]
MWIFLLLAILQGLIEWLPISSEGQSVLFLTSLLGIEPAVAISIALWLHIGTVGAVIIFYRNDFLGVIKGSTQESSKLRQFLLVSTTATGILGVPLYLLIKNFFDPGYGDVAMLVVGVGLIMTGVALLISRKVFGDKTISDISWMDAFIIGAVQGLTILPGISRSGFTIAALLWRGYSQSETLRLSFMMSVPAVVAGVILDYIVYGIPTSPELSLITLAIMILLAFAVGFATIGGLTRISRRINFAYFCIVLGIIATAIAVPALVGGAGAGIFGAIANAINVAVDWLINVIIIIGPIGFFAVMIVQAIAAPIPSEAIIMFGGGAFFSIYGFWTGLLITGIVGGLGECAGALFGFYISRFGGRPIALRLIGKTGIQFADEWFTRWGGWAVLVGRLVPLIPFDAVSYGAGLTRMRFRSFMTATAVGAFPRAFFYGYLGILLIMVGSTGGLEWIYIIVGGIIAVIIASSLITRYYITRRTTITKEENSSETPKNQDY